VLRAPTSSIGQLLLQRRWVSIGATGGRGSSLPRCGARNGRIRCPARDVNRRRPPPPQCSIALWRGYVSAQFYARAQNSGAFDASPTFRTWRFPWEKQLSMNKNPAALAALEALCVDLRSRGWERVRRAPGSDWYEYRFRFVPEAMTTPRRVSPHSSGTVTKMPRKHSGHGHNGQ